MYNQTQVPYGERTIELNLSSFPFHCSYGELMEGDRTQIHLSWQATCSVSMKIGKQSKFIQPQSVYIQAKVGLRVRITPKQQYIHFSWVE